MSRKKNDKNEKNHVIFQGLKYYKVLLKNKVLSNVIVTILNL